MFNAREEARTFAANVRHDVRREILPRQKPSQNRGRSPTSGAFASRSRRSPFAANVRRGHFCVRAFAKAFAAFAQERSRWRTGERFGERAEFAANACRERGDLAPIATITSRDLKTTFWTPISKNLDSGSSARPTKAIIPRVHVHMPCTTTIAHCTMHIRKHNVHCTCPTLQLYSYNLIHQ